MCTAAALPPDALEHREIDMKNILAAIAALSILMGSPATTMADEVKTERVQFAKGATGIEIKGAISGYDTMHYIVGAGAGQSMRVNLTSKNKATYFNIFAPGKVPGSDEAFYIGDTGGNSFEGSLPESGDYLIQVYLYRNAARRNEKAQFQLDIAIDGKGGTSGKESSQVSTDDALVEGTNFNATGEIPCTRNPGPPMTTCKFGVQRKDYGGNGAVTVFWPDGGNRVIYFEAGKPVRYDESQADGGAKLSFTEKDRIFYITIGEQRFEIFDSVIFGG
jgi:hypothetical protein